MHERGRMVTRPGDRPGDTAKAASTRLPDGREMAAYAAAVRRLTNYEVWRNVEAALLTMVPGQESEESGWWRLRILLDELNWRYSGLEGAGTASNRIPINIYPN